MERSRTKMMIIIVSCALHLMILLILLFIYHTPLNTAFNDFFCPTPPPAETIFSEPSIQSQNFPAQESGWAQMNAAAGASATSLDDFDQDIATESTQTENEETNMSDTDLATEQKENTIADKNITLSDLSATTMVANQIISSPSSEKKAAQTKKREAQKTLAGITKGYLEYINTQGNNLIQTIGGDSSKRPTAQQLKYERYIAKIIWCWQNSCKIVDNRIIQELLDQRKSLRTSIVIQVSINRDGKMIDCSILQSTGDKKIDSFIVGLWKHASSSFPPLPGYIKQDPLALPFFSEINWY